MKRIRRSSIPNLTGFRLISDGEWVLFFYRHLVGTGMPDSAERHERSRSSLVYVGICPIEEAFPTGMALTLHHLFSLHMTGEIGVNAPDRKYKRHWAGACGEILSLMLKEWFSTLKKGEDFFNSDALENIRKFGAITKIPSSVSDTIPSGVFHSDASRRKEWERWKGQMKPLGEYHAAIRFMNLVIRNMDKPYKSLSDIWNEHDYEALSLALSLPLGKGHEKVILPHGGGSSAKAEMLGFSMLLSELERFRPERTAGLPPRALARESDLSTGSAILKGLESFRFAEQKDISS